MEVFATVLMLVMTAVLVWQGHQLGVETLHDDRQRIEQQKAALAAQWRQLDQTRRIRAVFLTAHRAMQAEAQRSDVDQEGER